MCNSTRQSQSKCHHNLSFFLRAIYVCVLAVNSGIICGPIDTIYLKSLVGKEKINGRTWFDCLLNNCSLLLFFCFMRRFSVLWVNCMRRNLWFGSEVNIDLVTNNKIKKAWYINSHTEKGKVYLHTGKLEVRCIKKYSSQKRPALQIISAEEITSLAMLHAKISVI